MGLSDHACAGLVGVRRWSSGMHIMHDTSSVASSKFLRVTFENRQVSQSPSSKHGTLYAHRG